LCVTARPETPAGVVEAERPAVEAVQAHQLAGELARIVGVQGTSSLVRLVSIAGLGGGVKSRGPSLAKPRPVVALRQTGQRPVQSKSATTGHGFARAAQAFVQCFTRHTDCSAIPR
jgi:hypothetical protein